MGGVGEPQRIIETIPAVPRPEPVRTPSPVREPEEVPA
jgi:hypothetical protein